MAGKVPYLIYSGPIRPSENSSAVRIAELIADHATVNLDGTYRMTALEEARELAGQDGAVVTGPDGDPVLYVVNVSYHQALKLDRTGMPADRATAARNLLSSVKWLALGGIRLRRAWTRSHAKSARAKLQLAIGLALVLGLFGLAVIGGLALVTAIWPDWLPSWMTDRKEGHRFALGILGLSFTLGAAYAYVKRRLSGFGRLVQHLLNYVENPQVRKEAAYSLERALDRIDELDEPGSSPPEFHILGYSFGGLLALDAMCPQKGTVRGRRLDRVSSLATVGCPGDFIRLYYPDYFDDRVALPAEVPWHNLFIGNDVLGSNFLDSPESDGATVPEEGKASRPERVLQPTENHMFGSPELTRLELLKNEGFSMHARYWSEDRRTSTLDALMPMWPPMKPAHGNPHGEGA